MTEQTKQIASSILVLIESARIDATESNLIATLNCRQWLKSLIEGRLLVTEAPTPEPDKSV